MKFPPRPCAQCDWLFEPRVANGLYCTARCRAKADRLRQAARQRGTLALQAVAAVRPTARIDDGLGALPVAPKVVVEEFDSNAAVLAVLGGTYVSESLRLPGGEVSKEEQIKRAIDEL